MNNFLCKTCNKIIVTILLVLVLLTVVAVFIFFASTDEKPSNTIEVTVGDITKSFDIPELDLRGYPMDHFEVEQWFLTRLNYHRDNYGLHPYEIYNPARVISIRHSLDMREHSFSRITSSDGMHHQDRHALWMGDDRIKVTSALTAGHALPDGPVTQEIVNDYTDRLFEREDKHSFIMNPTYYFIGIGFSVEEDGMGRLSLTFASRPNERDAHRARTPEEREIHEQEYLERVRAERGWTPPENSDD